jgi:PTH1 family peptidyl-tRNA hydrolase
LVFIGLGNPGKKYRGTRHNVGFAALENIAGKTGIQLKRSLGKKYRAAEGRYRQQKVVFVEPLTYMNRSGDIIPSLIRKYQAAPENTVVLCDNLDLPPAEVRVKKGGSAAGHNGLASLLRAFGTGEFIRIYIGIGRPENRDAVVSYVLGVPRGEEQKRLAEGVDRAAEAAVRLLEEPLERVMNEFNRKRGE